MNSSEFIQKLIELMDTEKEINLSTKLADIEDWDSLSMVSFYSFCNAALDKKISPEEIKSALTVEDLFKLVSD